MNKLHWVFIGVTVFIMMGLSETEPPYEVGHFLSIMILAPIWVCFTVYDSRKKKEIKAV